MNIEYFWYNNQEKHPRMYGIKNLEFTGRFILHPFCKEKSF